MSAQRHFVVVIERGSGSAVTHREQTSDQVKALVAEHLTEAIEINIWPVGAIGLREQGIA